MTQLPISDSNVRMGRPSLNVTPVLVRLRDDVPKRIDALVGKQKRAEFIREAVELELGRREKAIKTKASKAD